MKIFFTLFVLGALTFGAAQSQNAPVADAQERAIVNPLTLSIVLNLLTEVLGGYLGDTAERGRTPIVDPIPLNALAPDGTTERGRTPIVSPVPISAPQLADELLQLALQFDGDVVERGRTPIVDPIPFDASAPDVVDRGRTPIVDPIPLSAPQLADELLQLALQFDSDVVERGRTPIVDPIPLDAPVPNGATDRGRTPIVDPIPLNAPQFANELLQLALQFDAEVLERNRGTGNIIDLQAPAPEYVERGSGNDVSSAPAPEYTDRALLNGNTLEVVFQIVKLLNDLF